MRGRGFFEVLLLVGVTLAQAACSSVETNETEPPPPPPDPLVAYTAACEDVVAAQCRVFYTCHPSIAGQLFGSESDCGEILLDRCVRGASMDGNGVTVDTLKACAIGLGQIDCADFDADSFWVEVPALAACYPRGSLGIGEICFNGTQCKSGLCLNGTLGADSCGRCVDPAPAGAPCAFTFECAINQVCNLGVCTAASALGEACGVCQLQLLCVDGVCVGPPPDGTPCTDLFDCLGPAPDRYCAADGCASIPLVDEGAACGDDPPVACRAPFGCSLAHSVCERLPSEGEPCSLGFYGQFCAGTLWCVDGTCVAPGPALCRPPGFPP